MNTEEDNIIVKLPNGHLFRCDCGCNIFHHPKEEPELFKCNACNVHYEGIKNEDEI